MNRPVDDYFLGYFAHFLSTQKGYYGGILITSTRGVPREFRHSEAVKPGRLQAKLYAESLEASLGTDAMAPALYEALSIKPDVLLVDPESREMFGQFAYLNRPAALLRIYSDPDQAMADVVCMDGSLLDAREYQLKGAQGKERVYAYIEDENDGKAARALDLAQNRMNLLSPFDRVRTVLSEIALIEHGQAKK